MPFKNQVHVDRPLTELSIAYMQDQNNFIADKIFPKIPVKQQSNVYYIYDRGDFLRDDVKPRAPATEAAKVNFNLRVSDPYNCLNYALREDIPYETIQNQDDPLNLEIDATKLLTQKFLINKELKFANNFFTSGIWNKEYQGAIRADPSSGKFCYWSDYTNSNPLKDIRNAMTTMQLLSGGFRPNTLLVTRSVYDAMVDHPCFLDRVMYKPVGDMAIIESPELAKLFGLKKFWIMDAVYNKSPDGVADSNAFICGNNALLCYIADEPALRTPTAGYCFTWNGVFAANGGRGGLPLGSGEMAVISYWQQNIKSQIVEAETSYDLKVIGKDLGIFFKDVLAPTTPSVQTLNENLEISENQNETSKV